jgi:hypothetical protein
VPLAVGTYQMRRWDDTLREFDRALVIVPSGQNVILHNFDVLLAGRGDTAAPPAFAMYGALADNLSRSTLSRISDAGDGVVVQVRGQ